MRITSQMLNENMSKAGVSLQHHSLLDYVKGGKNAGSLFNIMNTKAGAAISSAQTEKYEDLSKAANQLIAHAEKLASKKEDSAMNKAKESGDKSGLFKEAEGLVESYNEMLHTMKYTPGTLNKFYRQSLSELTEESKEQLEELGITIESDGSLDIDKSKFNESSLEDIEKLLGSESSFLSKLAYTAEHIGDNADATLDNTSGGYSAKGLSKNGYTNRYDFRG